MSIATQIGRIAKAKKDIKEIVNQDFEIINNETIDKYAEKMESTYDEYESYIPWEHGEGSEFTLKKGGTGSYLKELEINGNTYQDSYSGKNLFNDYYSTTLTERGITKTKVDNGILVDGAYDKSGNLNLWLTTSNNGSYSNNMTLLKANTTYTISAKVVSGTISISTENIIRLSSRESDKSNFTWNYKNMAYSNNEYKVTVTPTSDIYTAGIRFTATSTDSLSFNNVLFQIQIEEGNQATSFEPYVGGIPSPNPDYPQEIEVVENKQVVNVHGKNLFYLDGASVGAGTGITMTKNNDGSYTFNGTATGGLQEFRGICILSENHTLSYTSNQTNSQIYIRTRNNLSSRLGTIQDSIAIDNLSDNISSSKSIECIALTFANGVSVNNFTIYPQLELDSTPTNFEPYHNKNYEIDLHSKNLFDKDNVNTLNAYISLGNNKITSSNVDKCLYIPIKNNTAYTISKIISKRFVIGCTDELPVINTTICNPISGSQIYDTSYTITSGNNSQYLVVFYYASNADTLTEQEILDSIQIEEGSTATNYEEFYDYKLCKIEDYQDVIFKNNQLSEYYDSTLDENSWYIKKEINKVVLDGNINALTYFGNYGVDNKPLFYIDITDILRPNNYNIDMIRATHYKPYLYNGGGATGMFNYGIRGAVSNNRIYIRDDRYTSADDINNWLLNDNVETYYVLATPTYEKITNSTLINQLEAIEKLDTYNNYTAVTAIGDLVNPELECVLFSQPAYQKWVNNKEVN